MKRKSKRNRTVPNTLTCNPKSQTPINPSSLHMWTQLTVTFRHFRLNDVQDYAATLEVEKNRLRDIINPLRRKLEEKIESLISMEQIVKEKEADAARHARECGEMKLKLGRSVGSSEEDRKLIARLKKENLEQKETIEALRKEVLNNAFKEAEKRVDERMHDRENEIMELMSKVDGLNMEIARLRLKLRNQDSELNLLRTKLAEECPRCEELERMLAENSKECPKCATADIKPKSEGVVFVSLNADAECQQCKLRLAVMKRMEEELRRTLSKAELLALGIAEKNAAKGTASSSDSADAPPESTYPPGDANCQRCKSLEMELKGLRAELNGLKAQRSAANGPTEAESAGRGAGDGGGSGSVSGADGRARSASHASGDSSSRAPAVQVSKLPGKYAPMRNIKTKLPKGMKPMNPKQAEKTLYEILESKCFADIADAREGNTPDTMCEYLGDFFASKVTYYPRIPHDHVSHVRASRLRSCSTACLS